MKAGAYLSDPMFKGTPAYIAPEVFKEEKVDEKCDIYALGMIIWEMCSMQRPWQDNIPVVVMARVAIQNERPPIPDSWNEGIKNIITQCWQTDPKKRPTAQ